MAFFLLSCAKACLHWNVFNGKVIIERIVWTSQIPSLEFAQMSQKIPQLLGLLEWRKHLLLSSTFSDSLSLPSLFVSGCFRLNKQLFPLSLSLSLSTGMHFEEPSFDLCQILGLCQRLPIVSPKAKRFHKLV